jgi:hypothetical protein
MTYGFRYTSLMTVMIFGPASMVLEVNYKAFKPNLVQIDFSSNWFKKAIQRIEGNALLC